MTDRKYKGYTIRVVGLSHHIFRPGVPVPDQAADRYSEGATGYSQSFAGAKRWINLEEERTQERRDFEDWSQGQAVEAVRTSPGLYGWR
jgi:hypothetical protein